MKKAISKVSCLIGGMLALLLSAPNLYADDTEIYLQGVPSTTTNNILFMIDTAGAGNKGTLIEDISQALSNVIGRAASNNNMGLARYYEGGQPDGSYVAFPVRPLVDDANTNVTSIAIDGGGDARQVDSSTAPVLDDTEITMDASLKERYGFVFDQVDVPRYAVINNAYIELDSDSPIEGASLELLGWDIADARALTGTDNLFGSDWLELGDSDKVKTTKHDGKMRVDVTKMVQQLVERVSWCGGEHMGLGFEADNNGSTTFTYHTTEGAAAATDTTVAKPTLHVQWDKSSKTTVDSTLSGTDTMSCMLGSNIAPSAAEDDAVENLDSTSVVTDSPLILGETGNLTALPDGSVTPGKYMSGVRFVDASLEQGSSIQRAGLHLKLAEVAGSSSVTIKGIAGHAGAFSADGSISTQTTTAASVQVSFAEGTTGYQTVEVSSILQELVDDANWDATNALGFVLTSDDPANYSVLIEAVDQGGSSNPYLTVDAFSEWPSDFLPHNREQLQDHVASLASAKGGGKPDTGMTTLDMGSYLTGRNEQTGGFFYEDNTDSQSQEYAAELFDDDLSDGSYDDYAVPPGTNDACSRNHVVMLAGKKPNDGPEFMDRVSGATDGDVTESNCSTDIVGITEDVNDVYTCMANYTQWLAFPGETSTRPTVTTNIIGFDLPDSDSAGYEAVATAGEGSYLDVATVDKLEDAFEKIINQLTTDNASLAAPGVAVNQLNRFQHLDQLYYAVFNPEFNEQWNGNLKRYRLEFTDDGPKVVDSRGDEAVDADGFFKDGTRSYWSDVDDGDRAISGGARGELNQDPPSRKLFVFRNDPATLEPGSGSITSTSFGSGTALEEITDETQLTASDYGLTDSTRVDNAYSFVRSSWGDPLHSEPRLVTYDITENADGSFSQDNVIFVSTNDGMLHAVDADDGRERFAFMPKEELKKTETRLDDNELESPDFLRGAYGLDNTWVPWRRVDADGNVSMYIYGSQRRGGRNMYALDVTDIDESSPAPKIQWQIRGGVTDGFSRLGQTWSRPTLTQVKINGAPVPVLVFGGGYDADSHDTAGEVSSGDTMGNAIYMINATNGELIWSSSNDSSNAAAAAHTQVADMAYSIPADVAAVDLDVDGIADHLYAVDLGGQIFRVDFNNENSGAGGLVRRVETLAQLGISENATYDDHRRFYAHLAAVLSIDANGNEFLRLMLGSGYRAHPLEENSTQDRAYMIKDKRVHSADSGSYSSPDPIDHDTLEDVDNTTDTDLAAADGWYLNFDKADGEKMLSAPVILDGVAYFSTYIPADLPDNPDCDTITGRSRLYVVDIVNGDPAGDFNNDGTVDDTRFEESVAPGLAPQAQLLIGGKSSSGDNSSDEEVGMADACGDQAQVAVLIGTSVRSGGFLKACGLHKTRWYNVEDEAGADKVLKDAGASDLTNTNEN